MATTPRRKVQPPSVYVLKCSKWAPYEDTGYIETVLGYVEDEKEARRLVRVMQTDEPATIRPGGLGGFVKSFTFKEIKKYVP